MANAILDLVAKFINSPYGQIAAGAAIGAGVYKCFKWVDGVLDPDTKFAIAVWALDKKAEPFIERAKVPLWADTFLSVFDTLLGKKHPSWSGFRRSAFVTYVAFALVAVVVGLTLGVDDEAYKPALRQLHLLPWQVIAQIALQAGVLIVVVIAVAGVVPDYLAALSTRRLVASARLVRFRGLAIIASVLVALAFAVPTTLIYDIAVYSMRLGTTNPEFAMKDILSVVVVEQPLYDLKMFATHPVRLLEIIPLGYHAFLSTIALILFVTCGFLVRFAHSFDVVADWIQRHGEFEKNVLTWMGVMAGALCAILYWLLASAMLLFTRR